VTEDLCHTQTTEPMTVLTPPGLGTGLNLPLDWKCQFDSFQIRTELLCPSRFCRYTIPDLTVISLRTPCLDPYRRGAERPEPSTVQPLALGRLGSLAHQGWRYLTADHLILQNFSKLATGVTRPLFAASVCFGFRGLVNVTTDSSVSNRYRKKSIVALTELSELEPELGP
jgi:hypothetical protein